MDGGIDDEAWLSFASQATPTRPRQRRHYNLCISKGFVLFPTNNIKLFDAVSDN